VDQPPSHIRIPVGNTSFRPAGVITEGLQVEQGLPDEELSPNDEDIDHHTFQQDVRWRCRVKPVGNGEMAHSHRPDDTQEPINHIAIGDRSFEPKERWDDGNIQDAGDKWHNKRGVLGYEMDPAVDYKSRNGEGDKRS
jgi:hypothetical protein